MAMGPRRCRDSEEKARARGPPPSQGRCGCSDLAVEPLGRVGLEAFGDAECWTGVDPILVGDRFQPLRDEALGGFVRSYLAEEARV